MANIDFPIIDIENNRFQISIDKNLYSNEAITAALYKYSHLFYIHQETSCDNSDIIRVVFESKDGKNIDSKIPKEFCNDLLDQQIRHNTNIQFGHIRDLIVEEAFKPVNTKQ